MEEKKQVKSFAFAYFFIALIPIIFAFLFKGIYIFGDDTYQLYFTNNGVLDFVKNVDHGCLVSVFFLKFIGSFVPHLFGIHPANNYFGVFFRGLNFTLISFLLYKFLSYYILDKRTKQLSFLFITLAFLSFFFVMQDTEAYNCFFILAKHCRYVFSMVAYLLFWYLIYKIFIEAKPLNKRQSMGLFISAMWLGVSVESANISSIVSLILFLAFVFSLKVFSAEKQENKLIKIFFNKNFMIVFGLFILGVVFALTNHGFTDIAEKRGIANAITNLYQYFGSFIIRWFALVFLFHHFWILTLSNILLSIFILKYEPDKIKALKIVFFAWCLIAGISCFQLSLITLGKTYYIKGQFWIEAGTLKFDTLVVLIAAFCVLFGKVLCFLDSQKVLKMFKNLTIVAFMVLIAALLTKNSIVSWNMYLIKQRKILYKAEKMYLLYANKNQTAILSEDIFDSMFAGEFLGLGGWERPGYITDLYPKLYGIKPVKMIFVPDKVAMAIFQQNGGSITSQEINKPDFTRLLKEYAR